ncbi:Protein of unknown function [Marinobacterium lutimaris]|uniref:Tetratricopeptide repeat-containing protein n=2 Tax=Marinobacterium lutimaris TaxID=568106 RepID=A0A1H6DH18_9GAMM|nr:Protein of unknown function [Marinobacterium lutimaris]
MINMLPVSICRSCKPATLAALIAVCPLTPVWADDLDTQLRLNQSIERQNRETERELLADEDYLPGKRPQLVIDGKRYSVGKNASDLGRAIYLSLQRKQWSAVLAFMQEYETLPNADPLLLAYARGALARVRGDMEESEQQYRRLLELNPGFLPARLELARILFENHKDAEAETLFKQIELSLDPLDRRQDGVRSTVGHFRAALTQRRAWNGSIAFGPTWNDNLNQSSESRTCLLSYAGQCFYERRIPDAVTSTGIDYEATLNKQMPLSGHHGVYFRSLLYGQSYEETPDYDESTLTAEFGYRYQDLDDQIRIAPSFEFSRYANDSLYGAWGLHAEWMRHLSPTQFFKLEGEYQYLDYRSERYRHYNGPSYSANATYWHQLPDNWVLFAGVDWLYRQASESIYAYRQPGLRVGASKQFDVGIDATLLVSRRQREYASYSPILGEKRSDTEQNYTLILKAPRLELAGFYPSLNLTHRSNDSNVDWLYNYDQNRVSLKLEKRF